MTATIDCPTCGGACRVADARVKQEVRCAACYTLVPYEPKSAAPPTSPAPPNRTVLAQPEAMVRYTCPKCKRSLESPASFAGQKLNCPGCNQRLQIPQPSPPSPAPVPANKTILAKEESAAPTAPPSVPAAPPPLPPVAELVPVELAAPAARESCLECGSDLTQRARVQTCPDCGSLFCSSGCYREHRHHAHRTKKRRQREFVECEYCGSDARPFATAVISQGGWAVFVILLIFFFPLCWIGLLMTETQYKCADCGAILN